MRQSDVRGCSLSPASARQLRHIALLGINELMSSTHKSTIPEKTLRTRPGKTYAAVPIYMPLSILWSCCSAATAPSCFRPSTDPRPHSLHDRSNWLLQYNPTLHRCCAWPHPLPKICPRRIVSRTASSLCCQRSRRAPPIPFAPRYRSENSDSWMPYAAWPIKV